MLSCYFRALRLGGVLTSPQATPSGLQMTPPSLPGTENPGKHGSPDFILIMQHVRQPESWRQFGLRTNVSVSPVRKITHQYETRSAGKTYLGVNWWPS